MLTAEKKLKAIESLIKHGPRGSEWQEAGILHAIEQIVNGEVTDVSAAGLKRLMLKARKF